MNVVKGIKDNNSHSFKINSLIIRDSIDHASKVARKLKMNNMLQIIKPKILMYFWIIFEISSGKILRKISTFTCPPICKTHGAAMNVEAKSPYSVTSSSQGILPKPLFLKNTSVVRRRAIEAIIKLENTPIAFKIPSYNLKKKFINLNKLLSKRFFINLIYRLMTNLKEVF